MEEKNINEDINSYFENRKTGEFFVESEKFENLIIKKKNDTQTNFFYFFDNKQNKLIKKFVLLDGNKIQKICIVTLIEKEKKIVPRFTFQIYNKTKKAYENYKKKEIEHSFIKAHVDLNDCHKNFIKLINFIKSFDDVDFSEDTIQFINKKDKSLVDNFNLLFGDNKEKVLKNLKNISSEKLINAKNIIDITNLENKINEFENNLYNNSEKFWQNFFVSNPWFLTQIFYLPYFFYKKEFFVGGKKQGEKKGDKFTDFALKSKNLDNLAIIEIKTPDKKLVSNTPYSTNIYPMGRDLLEGVSQILEQKKVLQENYNRNGYFKVLDSKAILIIGKISSLKENEAQETEEKNNSIKIELFELFRNSLKNFEIITYDEVLERAKFLLEQIKNR